MKEVGLIYGFSFRKNCKKLVPQIFVDSKLYKIIIEYKVGNSFHCVLFINIFKHVVKHYQKYGI